MFQLTMIVCGVLFGADIQTAPPSPHPLEPLLEYAEKRLCHIDENVHDYSCTLHKRERLRGQVSKNCYAQVKVRHHQVDRDGNLLVPFSVYMRFETPEEIAGREVLYVEGRNHGRLIARKGGSRLPYITLGLYPDSTVAMRESRYPITELGIKNLIERLVEVGREELQYGEIAVEYLRGAKVNERVCTVVQVTHPTRRDYFRYHLARVFIDDELGLPIRYASYDWPRVEGGRPRLIEEFTYLDLSLNPGLTDHDFDHRNDEYQFRKDYEP